MNFPSNSDRAGDPSRSLIVRLFLTRTSHLIGETMIGSKSQVKAFCEFWSESVPGKEALRVYRTSDGRSESNNNTG